MKIYTASKFENAEAVRQFNARLREHGHVVTWDWTSTREFLDDGTVLKATPEDRRSYAMLDYAGVMAADLVIMLDGEWALNGARWEAGMAIGKGADVWIVNYTHRVVFDDLPQVHIIRDEEEALSLLGRATAVA